MHLQIDQHLRVQDTTFGRSFGRTWVEIGARQRRNLDTCIAMLQRGYGVKAVTPDDGWVDRHHNSVVFPSYARVVGHVGVGSAIALGAEDTGQTVIGHFRIVRITAVDRPGLLLGPRSYSFVEEVPRFEMVGPEPT